MQIVARPVRHEGNQLVVRAVRRLRQLLVENSAEHANEIDVPPLLAAADIVSLAHLALLQHREQRRGMIADIEPVAHVLAPAVDRKRLALVKSGAFRANENVTINSVEM